MKKLLILIFAISLSIPVSAEGVEYGKDATGDPNAVWVMGASGFLYSDRIVFTVAHTIEYFGNDLNVSYLFAPGVKIGPDQKKYFAQKILIAPTYRARVGTDNTRVDDFAIIILRESMPVRNSVQVASPADIESFIREKAPVEMVGYGFQNEAMRTDLQAKNNLAPHKMTSVLVSGEDLRKYYNAYPAWIQPNQTILDFGIPNNATNGSVCDGDSGAGFFVEKGITRYYLGAVGGSQAGITNCNGSFVKFAPHGGMSGFSPTHKFLALIKEAEDFVANEKREEARVAAELKVKQEADAKAAAELVAKQEAEAKAAADLRAKLESEAEAAALKKRTIICIKGKLVKKVTAVKPKCPSGYKLKK
ncbi:Serine proteases, trypsin domain containing protein [Candidatus Nanopelagicaceae bacterium]